MSLIAILPKDPITLSTLSKIMQFDKDSTIRCEGTKGLVEVLKYHPVEVRKETCALVINCFEKDSSIAYESSQVLLKYLDGDVKLIDMLIKIIRNQKASDEARVACARVFIYIEENHAENGILGCVVEIISNKKEKLIIRDICSRVIISIGRKNEKIQEIANHFVEKGFIPRDVFGAYSRFLDEQEKEKERQLKIENEKNNKNKLKSGEKKSELEERKLILGKEIEKNKEKIKKSSKPKRSKNRKNKKYRNKKGAR